MTRAKKIVVPVEAPKVVEAPVEIVEEVEAPEAAKERTIFIGGAGFVDLGINGQFFKLPRGREIGVNEDMYHALLNAGVISQ
jgi:hypothetical protein